MSPAKHMSLEDLDGIGYCPYGVFYAVKDLSNKKKGSHLGGKDTKGYPRVYRKGRNIKLHRAAAVLMGYDLLPTDIVDHLDGSPENNRWDNLRVTDTVGNNGNRIEHRGGHLVGTRKTSSGKWSAQGCRKQKITHIGTYDTQEQAHAAYMRWAK